MMRAARFLLAAAVALLAGCASQSLVEPQVREALAPTGTLRVGVYPGSPTSLVRTAGGEARGLAVELGRALGERLGVPVSLVEFTRVPEVVDAVREGRVDFTLTNATPARAKAVDFSEPVVRLELGYLVPAGSRIAEAAAVDRPGIRVGVTQGSTSQGVLGQQLREARLVAAPSVTEAAAMLARGELDAYATNKAILFEMSDRLPGSRVLEGRWGLEHIAIAVPKGRDGGRAFMEAFVREARHSGLAAQAAARAGLRGLAEDR